MADDEDDQEPQEEQDQAPQRAPWIIKGFSRGVGAWIGWVARA